MPFRWDLVAPDQLGSLLDGVTAPHAFYLGDLAECAGKVLARSGNGDLVFVGRSLDSMFDLLSGALSGTMPYVARLPLSFRRSGTHTRAEIHRAREVMTDLGITPAALARRGRPVTFVDVVHEGSTFTRLFSLLHDWITEEREPWPVIRRKLRFVGVTKRRNTSPNTFRWQQHAQWTGLLPTASVVNVSLDRRIWEYFGDYQPKLTRSYHPNKWLVEGTGPDRDDRTRQALAEAVHLVSLGRRKDVRRMIARAIDGEPALAKPWLRTLFHRLHA